MCIVYNYRKWICIHIDWREIEHACRQANKMQFSFYITNTQSGFCSISIIHSNTVSCVYCQQEELLGAHWDHSEDRGEGSA